jgi:hypothetical protein
MFAKNGVTSDLKTTYSFAKNITWTTYAHMKTKWLLLMHIYNLFKKTCIAHYVLDE